VPPDTENPEAAVPAAFGVVAVPPTWVLPDPETDHPEAGVDAVAGFVYVPV